MKKHSEKFLKKRKFLLALPVLIIPFLTMAFWAAGGGKGEQSQEKITVTQGLNTKLPDPKIKDDPSLNKLSFYELAQKDSQKLRIARENDRFELGQTSDSSKYSLSNLKNIAKSQSEKYHQQGLIENDSTYPYQNKPDRSKAAELKLMRKLHQLETEINKPVVDKQGRITSNERAIKPTNQNFSSDIDRLENMVKVMKSNGSDDPEMRKLDSMLERIIDIQNPERVKAKLKEQSSREKQKLVAVKPVAKAPSISVIGAEATFNDVGSSAFYNISGNKQHDVQEQNAIEAVIHETQTLVTGSVVKLRLLNDIDINGTIIPKDNLLYGTAQLNDERLKIEINSITFNNSIYEVNLETYDLDGLVGIRVPGAISRDVAKQSANSSIQSTSFSTLDPSLAAQATTAGINAAKDLFSKKVKLIKVTLKAGYKVLLKINNK